MHDSNGLERIRGEVVDALSSIPTVLNIDAFGSIATGRADQWSDLDLLVTCEELEHTPWLAAAGLRATRNVAFYRMFSDVAPPSGRYWFCGESPFHRLDISFYSPEQRESVIRGAVRLGHPIHLKPEYVATPLEVSAEPKHCSPAVEVEVTPRQAEVGRLLYLHLEATKDHLRGRPTKRSFHETRAKLLNSIREPSHVAGDTELFRFVLNVDEFLQSILS